MSYCSFPLSIRRSIQQRNYFSDFPNTPGSSIFLRWRTTQGLMNAATVVISEVKPNGVHVILSFL